MSETRCYPQKSFSTFVHHSTEQMFYNVIIEQVFEKVNSFEHKKTALRKEDCFNSFKIGLYTQKCLCGDLQFIHNSECISLVFAD